MELAYDLGELGRHDNRYIAYKRHWRAVAPPGHILRLPYERMVADTEAETGRVIAHSRGQALPAGRSGTGR